MTYKGTDQSSGQATNTFGGRAGQSKFSSSLGLLFLCLAVATLSAGCLPPIFVPVEVTYDFRSYSSHILETNGFTSAMWYYQLITNLRHFDDLNGNTLEVYNLELKNTQSALGSGNIEAAYPVWGTISVADTTAKGGNTKVIYGLQGHEMNSLPRCSQTLCTSSDEIFLTNWTVGWQDHQGPSVDIIVWSDGALGDLTGMVVDDVFYSPY